MYKTIIAGVAGAMLAGSAMAAEPVKLTDGQMDDVTAGFRLAAGGGFGTGPLALTFGLGTATSSSQQLGGGGFNDSITINTGGVTLSSVGLAEGSSTTSTSYASAVGGFSWTGISAGGGAVVTIP